MLQRLTELRSGDAERVRAVLRSEEGFDLVEMPQVIRLLAWEEVAADAVQILIQEGGRITGMLIDNLTDETQDFAVRAAFRVCWPARARNAPSSAC